MLQHHNHTCHAPGRTSYGRRRTRGFGQAGRRPVHGPRPDCRKESGARDGAQESEEASTGLSARNQPGLNQPGTDGLCPYCDRRCPLSAPGCRKGRALAAALADDLGAALAAARHDAANQQQGARS